MPEPSLVYYTEVPDPNRPVVYFAGPTMPAAGEQPWQLEGATILGKLGFTGSICLPMPRDGVWRQEESDAQIEWQLTRQEQSDIIVFWVPRPGWVTWTEFGDWYRSGKVVLGIPPGVEKTDYLVYCARRHRVPLANSLRATMAVAAGKLATFTSALAE